MLASCDDANLTGEGGYNDSEVCLKVEVSITKNRRVSLLEMREMSRLAESRRLHLKRETALSHFCVNGCKLTFVAWQK